MARSGAAGRVCYLALLLTAAVIFYQHHVAMQKELTHYQRAALQFEKMYDESMKTVSEWKNKYESEKIKSAEVLEAHDLTKKQLSEETQSKQTLQNDKASAESKLQQAQQAQSHLDSDLQSKAENLKKALDQLSQSREQTKDLESRISSYSTEAEQLKKKVNSLEVEKQQLENQVKQMVASTKSQKASLSHTQENRGTNSRLDEDEDLNLGEDIDGVTNSKRNFKDLESRNVDENAFGGGQRYGGGASNEARRDPDKLEFSHTGIGFGGDAKKMEGNLRSTVEGVKKTYGNAGGWNAGNSNTEGQN